LHNDINTLGQLKQSTYKSRGIKDEIRENLIAKLEKKEQLFQSIVGYEDTVIPDLQRALLSRHNILFLGLRGQAKTRIARLMVELLDEYMPIVKGSELNDDPYNPLSRFALDLIEEMGEETPIEWVHRSKRYAEKLATPDVSIADLIGDADPIKAATLKLPYSDERVIHFGLVPRANRCIFVINELPDLQARIQVALFNILQEGDIQIRGFKLRLPLDLQFVFTANPEDYTNRGSIVTPLKDRIQSQILTHYPKNIIDAAAITKQEARILPIQSERVNLFDWAPELIEQIAFEARESEYVDAKSGVSARLTISAYEMLVSSIERRGLLQGIPKANMRIADLWGVIPAITGKVELVYEGEQEGTANVAQILLGKALRSVFKNYFPDPEASRKTKSKSPYDTTIQWFGQGNSLEIMMNMTDDEYKKSLMDIPGLADLIEKSIDYDGEVEKLFLMEFALHGMAEFSLISKMNIGTGNRFKDILSGMFEIKQDESEDEELY